MPVIHCGTAIRFFFFIMKSRLNNVYTLRASLLSVPISHCFVQISGMCYFTYLLAFNTVSRTSDAVFLFICIIRHNMIYMNASINILN